MNDDMRGGTVPLPHPEGMRLNLVAEALKKGWDQHIPLSVRYKAAEAADKIVDAWWSQSGREDDHG